MKLLLRLLLDKKLSSLFSLVWALAILSCSYINKAEKRHEIQDIPAALKMPPQKVHLIETLELNKAQKNNIEAEEKTGPEPVNITLSLEECRALALKNNLELQIQLISPAVSRESINEEKARFEAVFSGTIEFTEIDSPQETLLEGSREHAYMANLGVDIPLRTGGRLTFNHVDTRKSTASMWSILNPYYYSGFEASISQPLLRNAGIRTNAYSIRMAQYNSRIVDAATKLKAIRILANLDIVYWRLYAARKLLEIRKQQYDLSKVLFEQTKRFAEIGLKPKIEVLRTEAGMAERLDAIIDAENDVRRTERSLKRMLNKNNLGMETNTLLIPSTPPDPIHYKFERHIVVKKAIENRMELLELELRLAQDNENIGYYKNQTLPLVVAEYKYNLHGLGGQRHRAYGMLTDNEYNDHNFSVFFSIPLNGNEAAKSNYRKAVYERSQRLATKESKEAEIRNEVLDQLDRLEAGFQKILAARQVTLLRDRQYKTERKQYELGFSASTDVMDSQTKFAEARIMEIIAVAEYQIALTDLAYATGTLLGSAKVEILPVIVKE